jgi:hypothetical protein
MKRIPKARALLGLLAALMIAGCAHEIDWRSRVGQYTFDQAVTEFGPPDKQARLSDGELVAEWVRRYYNGGTATVGAGYYGSPGPAGVMAAGPVYYESTLRLTFSTNNVLSSWSKH